MNTAIRVILSIIVGYLLGSISTAQIVGTIFGHNVKKEGSNNAGASNVVVVVGKRAGIFVAFLDVVKGFAAWHIARLLFPELPIAGIIAGESCIWGHIFPVFTKFKGGKGFACLMGNALATGFPSFFIMLGLVAVLSLLTNYIAVVACIIAVAVPLYLTTKVGPWALLLLISAPLVISLHFENFKRIKAGTEVKISYLFNKKEKAG